MAFHTFRQAGKSIDPPMSDINVTPLVDVMLVLLVIFIITAPLMTSAIRLDLPTSDAARPAQPPQSVALVIDRDGQVHLGDERLDADALVTRLQAVARQHPDTEVQLRADTAVAYGRVVQIIGLSQRAGLNRIGFVAETPAGAAAAP